jgi:hypothetical protein
VLFLFTRAPLGIAASLAVGVVLVTTHRLYARPFALAHAGRRCLWCGRGSRGGPNLIVEEPLGTTAWSTCGEPHRERARRFLAWASDHRRVLQGGILGALAAFLAAAALVAAGLAGALTYPDAVNGFRLAIALTVLPLGLLALRGPVPPDRPLRTPFPVHIQALIGTAAVVWLFRLVGLAWLVLAVRHFAARP